jgi:hypothetical protein
MFVWGGASGALAAVAAIATISGWTVRDFVPLGGENESPAATASPAGTAPATATPPEGAPPTRPPAPSQTAEAPSSTTPPTVNAPPTFTAAATRAATATPTPPGSPQIRSISGPNGSEWRPDDGGCIVGSAYPNATYTIHLTGAATVTWLRLEMWPNSPESATVTAAGGAAQTVQLQYETGSGDYRTYSPVTFMPVNVTDGVFTLVVNGGGTAVGLCKLELS